MLTWEEDVDAPRPHPVLNRVKPGWGWLALPCKSGRPPDRWPETPPYGRRMPHSPCGGKEMIKPSFALSVSEF